MVYCVWNSPELSKDPATTNALTDCTIMLYVMAERWPQARKYRDTFERLKQIALEREIQTDVGSKTRRPIRQSSTARPVSENHRADAPPSSPSGTTAGESPELATAVLYVHSSDNRNLHLGIGSHGSNNNVALHPSLPHTILDIVREPFLMWDDNFNDFDFNFDFAATPSASVSAAGHGPTSGTSLAAPLFAAPNPTAAYTSDQAIPPDFSFCPGNFGHAESYDFDPILYDLPMPSETYDDYRGALGGAGDHYNTARR